MADQNKEHELFSEDFEKRARELLDDPAFRPEETAEDNAPVKESILFARFGVQRVSSGNPRSSPAWTDT